MSRLYLSNPCAFFRYFSHTALRAQSAPGFPCALCSREGQRRCRTRAKTRRGNENVCAVASLQIPLSSRRRPGPIRRGGYCLARWSSACPRQHPPVVMGPGLRRDDDGEKLCSSDPPVPPPQPAASSHISRAQFPFGNLALTEIIVWLGSQSRVGQPSF